MVPTIVWLDSTLQDDKGLKLRLPQNYFAMLSCCQSAVTDEAVNDVPSMDVQDDQSIDLHSSIWLHIE